MYSEAERAAFAALLDRARKNEPMSEDEVRAVLPPDLAAEFTAYAIRRQNELIDRYDELVWEKYQSDPDTIKYYKDQLHLSKKAFRAAPMKLEKLVSIGDTQGSVFSRNVAILANQRTLMWRLFEALSDDDKLWAKPNSQEQGWPPELVDEPPMAVVMPGEELPECYGVRRTLTRIVEGS